MVEYNYSGMCKLSQKKIDGDVTPKIKSPRNFNQYKLFNQSQYTKIEPNSSDTREKMHSYAVMQDSVDKMQVINTPIRVARESSKSVLQKKCVPYLLPEAGKSQFEVTHTNFLKNLDRKQKIEFLLNN